MAAFTHLHVHSRYSLLSGASSPAELVAAAARYECEAVALTDTNGLYGAAAFQHAAQAAGVRPIFGGAITTARGERAVLLAATRAGYGDICRVITARHCTADFDLAAEIARTGVDDVHVLSASPAVLRQIVRTRGRRNVWVEMHNFGRLRPLREAQHLADGLGLAPVATNAVHFATPPQYAAHRLLTAVQHTTTVYDLTPDQLAHEQACFKSPAVMAELFRDYPHAVTNTERIADACRMLLPLGRPQCPRFPLPDEEDSHDHLLWLCHKGLRARYGRTPPPAAVARLDKELAIIRDKNFSDYFLILWDLVQWAKRAHIPTVGRGSAAHSIVTYVLGISDVEPIRYNLYFERFLHADRKDFPDVDLDFPWDRRADAQRYVAARYGADRVAIISAHVTLQGRFAMREAAKALGIPLTLVGDTIKRIPHTTMKDLARAVETTPACRDIDLEAQPFKDIYQAAMQIGGAPRHLMEHSAGFVVTPYRITDIIPLQRSGKDLPLCQYEMRAVEALGFPKIDIPGNRTLGVIPDATAAIAQHTGRRIDFDGRDNPYADAYTRSIIRRGKTMGVFYIESPRQLDVNKMLRVDTHELLTIASSIVRPAVLGATRAFVARQRGLEPVPRYHPLLDELFTDTYGLMIYEEDIDRTVTTLAGFTHREAERLRKAVKDPSRRGEYTALIDKFGAAARARGVPPEAIQFCVDSIESFAGYSFVKGHSAAYAQVSFKAAYLKAHYPAEFMAAVLSNGGGFYRADAYISECRRIGLSVLPPCVNMSQGRYTGRGSWVRIGLMQVRDLSAAAIERIVDARADGPYQSLADFVRRVPMSASEIDNLILCGACDCFGEPRAQMMRARPLYRRPPRAPDATLMPVERRPPRMRAAAREFDGAQLRAYEYDLLGVHVVPPSLATARAAILVRGLRYPLITARHLPLYCGQTVTFVGWVVTEKQARTKGAREAMKFLTMEDETGWCEVTVFPRAYQQYGHVLGELGPQIVEGVVEEDLGIYSITASAIARHTVNFLRSGVSKLHRDELGEGMAACGAQCGFGK